LCSGVELFIVTRTHTLVADVEASLKSLWVHTGMFGPMVILDLVVAVYVLTIKATWFGHFSIAKRGQ